MDGLLERFGGPFIESLPVMGLLVAGLAFALFSMGRPPHPPAQQPLVLLAPLMIVAIEVGISAACSTSRSRRPLPIVVQIADIAGSLGSPR